MPQAVEKNLQDVVLNAVGQFLVGNFNDEINGVHHRTSAFYNLDLEV